MTNNLEKPTYEEYWPNIDGLAQREKITDETIPARTFFDIAVVHILTTCTINRLRKLYPGGRFEIRGFRLYLVIASSGSEEKDFIENLGVDKKIIIGEGVVLKVTGPCTRCVMPTLAQGDLPKDLGILQTIVKYNHVMAGVYASVSQGGVIYRGDSVYLEEET